MPLGKPLARITPCPMLIVLSGPLQNTIKSTKNRVLFWQYPSFLTPRSDRGRATCLEVCSAVCKAGSWPSSEWLRTGSPISSAWPSAG